MAASTDRTGVCRDFAHLAITLCRCMNIPARYCTGYLGDIGVPPVPDPMDFSAWFEVYLGGRWFTFDARHNTPRIGRILMATGRDATDVALSTSFGASRSSGFKVVTDEVPHAAPHTNGIANGHHGVHHSVPGGHAPGLARGGLRRGADRAYSQPRILKTQ